MLPCLFAREHFYRFLLYGIHRGKRPQPLPLPTLGVTVQAAVHPVLPVGEAEDVGQFLLDGGDAPGILAPDDPVMVSGRWGWIFVHPLSPRMMFTVMWGSMYPSIS